MVDFHHPGGKVRAEAGEGLVWLIIDGGPKRGEVCRVGMKRDAAVRLVSDLLDANSEALKEQMGLKEAS